MNVTITYNTNQETIVELELKGVLAPEIAGNAFLQFRNQDTSLNCWIPLGRVASVQVEHDLVQPASSIPAPGSKLSLV